MRFDRTIPMAIVAMMVLGGCIGMFVPDADASATIVVNDAEPLEISDGKITGDCGSWGATFSYDGTKKIATLTFDGNRSINCNGDKYVISSDVDLVIVLNGNLTIADNATVDEGFYGITSNDRDLTIKGPGTLTFVSPRVGEGSDVRCLNNEDMFMERNLTIENANITIMFRDTGEAKAIAIHSSNISIIDSRISIRTIAETKNDYVIYGTYSNGLHVERCMIDVDLKSTNCDGFRASANEVDCLFKNSIIDITLNSVKGCHGVYSPRCQMVNCDVTIFGRSESAASEGVNRVLATDHSNVSVDVGGSIIHISEQSSLNPGEDYELLDADGNVVERVQDFMALKKGTIHNLKVTLKFDLGEGKGTPVESVIGPHGDYVFIPGCDATRDGKRFIGWTDGFRTFHEGDLYVQRMSLTLTAVYEDGDNTSITIACAVVVIPTLALLGLNFVGRRP